MPPKRPLLCAITDRSLLPREDLAAQAGSLAGCGVDLIQIREGDLPARDLLARVREAVALTAGLPVQVLVNDRLDIALAAGAAGVHLPARGLPVAGVRNRFPQVLIGASTHNLDELRDAAAGGADFAVFGPVFDPLSKPNSRPATGLEGLSEAAAAVGIPVLALGGITAENAAACYQAGAAGLAGITLFLPGPALGGAVQRLRASFRA